MLTPLDIENKKFSKQMMNGYSIDEVDDFLDELTVDYEKMYKELQVKLEEFKIFKPMPAPIDKIQNRYRYRIIIKGNMTEKANKELNSILKQAYNENLKTTRISIDINPNNMS